MLLLKLMDDAVITQRFAAAQVSMRRGSDPSGDAGPSENVVSFVAALRGLQVPPDVVLRAEEVTDPAADVRRLLRCIMFLKNSEEVSVGLWTHWMQPFCSYSVIPICIRGYSVSVSESCLSNMQALMLSEHENTVQPAVWTQTPPPFAPQACRLRNFPLRAMESHDTPAAVSVPIALTADAEPADAAPPEEDGSAPAACLPAEAAPPTERLPPAEIPSLSQSVPLLPEPTMADSPTLPREAAFREVTPLAVRAAVRDTLTAASLQDPGLAPAAPSVRASADSTAAMAAILRQFTAHLRNQPPPPR